MFARIYSLLALSTLALTLAGTVGCGNYEARMQQRIGELKSGRAVVPGAPAAAGAIQPASDPRLFASPYTIYDSAGTKTGVTIYLPKEFVNADGSANFSNTEMLGNVRLTPPGNQTSLMTYFYADTSGKKLPAIIAFSRLPGGKAANAEQRAAAEGSVIAAALKVAAAGSPAPTMSDFPTASGNWRKMTYNQRSRFPVGDANGAQEEMDSRIDSYLLMTTEEGVMIQVTAPTSVTNTFDFFGAVEAGLKLMQAGPPTVTGSVP